MPTISIGVSLSRTGDDFVSLYQRADIALYDVKHQGKDNYVIDKE
nr:diguanylate cyclase [[Clostridium] innocuum]